MGQKTNPVSLRLKKTNRSFQSSWYSDLHYHNLLRQELKIKGYINKIFSQIKYPTPLPSLAFLPKKTKAVIAYFDPSQSRQRRCERFQLRFVRAGKEMHKQLLNRQDQPIRSLFSQGKVKSGETISMASGFEETVRSTVLQNLFHRQSLGLPFPQRSDKLFYEVGKESVIDTLSLAIGCSLEKEKTIAKREEKRGCTFLGKGVKRCFVYQILLWIAISKGGSRRLVLRKGFELFQKLHRLTWFQMREDSLPLVLNRQEIPYSRNLAINPSLTPLQGVQRGFVNPSLTPLQGVQRGFVNPSLTPFKGVQRGLQVGPQLQGMSGSPSIAGGGPRTPGDRGGKSQNRRKREFQDRYPQERANQGKRKIDTFNKTSRYTVLNQSPNPNNSHPLPIFDRERVRATPWFGRDTLEIPGGRTSSLPYFTGQLTKRGREAEYHTSSGGHDAPPSIPFPLPKNDHRTPSTISRPEMVPMGSTIQFHYPQVSSRTQAGGSPSEPRGSWDIPRHRGGGSRAMLTSNSPKGGTSHIPLLESIIGAGIGSSIRLCFCKSIHDQQTAHFLSEEIAYYLERRVPFRRIKQLLLRELKTNYIEGVKVSCAGRMGGRSKKAQRARGDRFQWGQTSCHVFSSKLSFASRSALTPLGKVGIKVWVCYK